MRYIYYNILVTIIAAFSIPPETISAQDFVIIVNSNNPVTSITKKEASDIFLKKKTTWQANFQAVPVDLSSSSALRAGFSKNIHNKTVSQVRAYWQQSVFSGKASPPSEMSDEQSVINYVKTHKGAVGYVSSKNIPVGVKVITIK